MNGLGGIGGNGLVPPGQGWPPGIAPTAHGTTAHGTTALPARDGILPSAEIGAPSFKDVLLDALQHVNSMQSQADAAVEQFAVGGEVDPAEVLTAVQKADLTFRMMMQIRNKLIQAYQEVKDIRI